MQDELVEVVVGPVVIWLLVGTSKDMGRRKPELFRSHVETDPVWNWLSDAGWPFARNSRDSGTTTTSCPGSSRIAMPIADARVRSWTLFRCVDVIVETGEGARKPGRTIAKLSSSAVAALSEIEVDPAL